MEGEVALCLLPWSMEFLDSICVRTKIDCCWLGGLTQSARGLAHSKTLTRGFVCVERWGLAGLQS